MFVFCCGMMRSGSTLQYQLAASISEESGKGRGIGEIRWSNFAELERAYSDDSIKVCKLHHIKHLKGARSALESGKAVGIYTFRDIRDVTVSLMSMRKTKFDNIVFKTREIPECLDNYYAWTSLPGLLISQYEEMSQNIPEEVERIAAHLNIELSPEKTQEIANAHSKQNQLHRIQKWNAKAEQTANPYDPKTLLLSRHINSGKSQQWKTTLTPIQIGYLESLAGNWLENHGYSLSQPLYVRQLSQLVYFKYALAKKLERLSHVLKK
ncbi:MAG: sulfotransferase domain-containing protein [Cyanophyceae cyanobacterium]